eukprot:4651000-Pyramimonas_sp.AAC.1
MTDQSDTGSTGIFCGLVIGRPREVRVEYHATHLEEQGVAVGLVIERPRERWVQVPVPPIQVREAASAIYPAHSSNLDPARAVRARHKHRRIH